MRHKYKNGKCVRCGYVKKVTYSKMLMAIVGSKDYYQYVRNPIPKCGSGKFKEIQGVIQNMRENLEKEYLIEQVQFFPSKLIL
jgi:hypothetical protein